MKKIFILITTYNRPLHLFQLLQQIHTRGKNFDIELLVIDDFSTEDYSKAKQYLYKNFPESEFFTTTHNYGKENYYVLIRSAYEYVLMSEFDYFIQLPDDVSLTANFFEKSIDIFDSITSENKAALNLITDISRFGRPCFNTIWPKHVKCNGYTLYETGWMDMCFLTTKNFFSIIDNTIHPISIAWAGNPKLSSGVGKQLSNRIVDSGFRFYQHETTLVIHRHGESKMHPKLRKNQPLLSKFDKITASVASFPPREKSLQHTVNSILPQVDELHIYLNEYDNIPKYLIHDKITVFRSQDYEGDLGDVGKFYSAEKIKGYHFTIDDDLEYPYYYVQKLISEIEKHDRKYAITLHGRVFNKLPVNSYYHGASFSYSCLNEVKRDKFIHIGGTGVMAYHTDTLKLSKEIFRMTNMADIWFSKYCHENNIKILCIAHEKGWVRNSPHYRLNETIYANCHNNDLVQTELINSVQWKYINQ